MKKRGYFIVFESAPKCGKSTLAREVVKRIENLWNKNILHKRGALSTSVFAKKITDRKIDKNLEYSSSFYWSDAIFDTADTILPNLNDGNLIIQERYDMSIVSYREIHGLNDDIFLLEEYLKRGLIIDPDITIVPYADIEIIKERIEVNSDSTEIDKKFIEKMKQHELMQQRIVYHLDRLGRRYVLIDTGKNGINESADVLVDKIMEVIK